MAYLSEKEILDQTVNLLDNRVFYRDFSKLQVLNPAVGQDITFTRSTSATRVNSSGLIETVGIDTPRFDYDPITRQCNGLLIEESRTNLLINSLFAGGGSVPTSFTRPLATGTSTPVSSILSNIGVAYFQSAASERPFFEQSVILTSGTQYTLSFNIESSSGLTYVDIALVLGGHSINARRLNGVSVSGGETIANGKFEFVITATSSGAFGVRFGPGCNGVATGSMTFSHPNFEAGSFATSYIPTTSTTVTRAADVATVTGSNFSSWYNQTEGTIAADLRINSPQNSSVETVVYFDDGVNGTNNRIWISKYDSSPFSMRGLVSSAGATVANVTFASSAVLANENIRSIFAIATDNFAGTQNGLSIQKDTSGAIPQPVFTRLAIGNRNGSNQLNGTISRISYYNKRLSDKTLRTLTLP